ncbi:MAG: hypothetical protein JRC90_00720 [Deltaproteobacteria bacterium]|nr:hypothetical protein [Deltaproteobacteria bacterium]
MRTFVPIFSLRFLDRKDVIGQFEHKISSLDEQLEDFEAESLDILER